MIEDYRVELALPGFDLLNAADRIASSASFTFSDCDGWQPRGQHADYRPVQRQLRHPLSDRAGSLASIGSVTNTYSATFVAIPEPSRGLTALGGLMVGAALLAKRKIAKG
jgi:hypothetical protein